MYLEIRKIIGNYAALFFLLAFTIIAIDFLHNGRFLLNHSFHDINGDCDIFSGRWVSDNASYPLYEERECSFMSHSHACLKFGRKDVGYQKWRWQPRHCNLPRFNGRELLEKIRGKRMVFVGDSISKNQWASMLCLIESSLNQSSPKSVIKRGNSLIFEATEYEATIETYWSPFLVESNCDDPFDFSNVQNPKVRITAIEKHASQWRDADFLVFDSYAWWLESNMTLLWRSFESSDAIYERVDGNSNLRHYEMGLTTWSDWLEININRTKTKLFFMSPSPVHSSRGEGSNVVAFCHNKTEPILEVGRIGIDRDMMHIADSIVLKLNTRGLNIKYLDISYMSDYRLDAHPSIYRKFSHRLSKERLANPQNYADCIHWCLPGLPDVWNKILYTYIMKSS